jgi:hypothetical protein
MKDQFLKYGSFPAAIALVTSACCISLSADDPAGHANATFHFVIVPDPFFRICGTDIFM